MISRINMAKRILIADDSVTIQKAFAMTFAGADDVTLTAARSADEGLAMAQKAQPDLIIADAVMPGRSGYDLCASVRTDPALRGVPVYILASTQQPYDEAKGQKAGATGHLSKPWDTTAILDRVKQALEAGAGAGAVAAPTPHVPSQRVASSLPTAAIEDDEYGEISIDSSRDTDQRSRVATPVPPVEDPRPRFLTPPPPSEPRPRVVTPPPPAPIAAPGGMRPSLIPGMRPGTIPPSRPGTIPPRPTGPQATVAPSRPAAAPVGRTMIGLPAAGVPIPGMRPGGPPPAAPAPPPRAPAAPMPPSAPVRPASGPVAPLAARGPGFGAHAPIAPAAPTPASPSAPHVVVGSAIEQKLAAYASKGPEYEAIAKLSREIIEQIAWEIIPDLAEAIIRAEVEKRGRV
jgi:CheY-like chemotaxis protein